MKLVAVILAFNEEQHLARCMDSLNGVASQIVVADCFSTDATLAIARAQARG
jgi:glycosyltransferase involved in cell wall biosynthesis